MYCTDEKSFKVIKQPWVKNYLIEALGAEPVFLPDNYLIKVGKREGLR